MIDRGWAQLTGGPGRALAVYVLSRVVLWFVMVVCAVIDHAVGLGTLRTGGPAVPVSHALPFALGSSWDGAWYESIALHGYGPAGAAAAVAPREAFFPAFPLLVRGGTAVTGWGVGTVGPLLGLLGGAVAVILLWLFAQRLFDENAADRAAALFSFAPGSFVLSMAYPEGLALAASIGCLLALHRGKWVVAGLAGAVAASAHGTALAVVPASVAAAIVAIHTRREWRSLLAVALSAAGGVSWFAWLWARSGDPLRWFDVQRSAWWTKGLSWRVPFDNVSGAIHHPYGVPAFGTIAASDVTTTVGLVLLVVGLAFLIRARLPVEQLVYTGFVVLTATFSIGARPRLVLMAVPLLLAVAGRARGRWFFALLAAEAALLPTVAVLSWAVPSVPP